MVNMLQTTDTADTSGRFGSAMPLLGSVNGGGVPHSPTR
jgi:hypothetical protein